MFILINREINTWHRPILDSRSVTGVEEPRSFCHCLVLILSRTFYGLLELSAIVSNLLQSPAEPSATVCNLLPPSATFCHRLQPSTTVYNLLPPSTTFRHRLQPSSTVYNFPPSSTTFYYQILFMITIVFLITPMPPVEMVLMSLFRKLELK